MTVIMKEAGGRDCAILDVLKGIKPRRRPMWFMRQAGRYLPEYRAVREKAGSFLDLCYNPELAAEVTVQPLRRYDLDAAILFADILVVPHAMGLPLRFEEGEGPILGTVRSEGDLGQLKPIAGSKEVAQVCRTVSLVREGLEAERALIGFCGGPWTVASYMIGGGSSDRAMAKIAAMQRQPWFVSLIDRLVVESVDYLCAQIVAGADVVQIFESWAGDLIGTELVEFVVKPVGKIVSRVRARHADVPIIVFARGLGGRQSLVGDLVGVSAVGVETEFDLELRTGVLGSSMVVQGNLDPVCLLAGEEVAVREALRVCGSIVKDKHIFNLGHGIRLGTDPGVVGAVVDAVRHKGC